MLVSLAVLTLVAAAALAATCVIQHLRWHHGGGVVKAKYRLESGAAAKGGGGEGSFASGLHVAFKDGLAIDKEQESGVAADVSALDREDLGPSGIMHRLAIHHGLAKHEYIRHVKDARPKVS